VDTVAVWALVMVGALVALGLTGLAVLVDRPRAVREQPPPAEVAELTGHAEAVRVDAARAVAEATTARDRVTGAETRRDEAWAAQEAAERAYDRAWAAALAGRTAGTTDPPAGDDRSPAGTTTPEPDPGPDVDDRSAERDRAVSRAALAAYKRGDISADQLREVWRRTTGWDPEQEERERLADRARIELAAARRAYDRAAAEVRRVTEAARVAEVAAEALLDEVAESAAEAHAAELAAHRPARRGPRRRGRAR
jgi:hypothetical protein